jgi:hypothetical protein
MFTLEYNFQPGGRVFVVIDDNIVEAGSILNITFKVYQNSSNNTIESVIYAVLLDDAGAGTVHQDSSTVFETLDDAGAYISNAITPTPTPAVTATVTPTITASVTPTVTPTISVTPTITP